MSFAKEVTVAFVGMNWAFGLLDVTGTATLAGAVDFWTPQMPPPANTVGTILKSGTRNGTLTPPADGAWTINQVGNDLTATKN